jgi:single-strand DNA-binding protein
MLNQIVLVGRLVSDPQINETESEKKVCTITLAVPRSYKNIDGEYETDFIDITLWQNIAEQTSEWCKKGDLIGIKGRIQTYMKDDNKITQLIAEKVSFLSSKANKDNEE